MTEKDIERINQLYHKSKSVGLTPEEAEEQSRLRHEYILAIRKNLRGNLDNISIQEKDGSITNLKDVGRKNRGEEPDSV
jgi:uncharacterized protein YnzC (UPF0291/DUF896 family)